MRRALGEASGGPDPETLLRDVTDAIAAAKTDSRIKLIVLDLDELDASGLSKLQEIGTALRDFRASGKRVIAMGDSFSQAQYYLAAQAGEVYLDPMGEVSVHGFSYYRMYYKDAIDKLEIDSNVFQAPAPSRAIPINFRAATWRRASARRPLSGSSPCGALTARMSLAPDRCPPPR